MKLRVAVLFGGQSVEHKLSRMSADSVLRNLDRKKYDIYRIGITREGKWIEYNGSIDKIENGMWEHDECYKNPDGYRLIFNREVDVVFPVLHGFCGEDGAIQGLCKLVNMPCVDCSVLNFIDFLVDNETSEIYLNKLNTIPGFTKINSYPEMWERSGKPYTELLDDLINLAVEKNDRRILNV